MKYLLIGALAAAVFGQTATGAEPIVNGDLAKEIDRYMERIEANGFSGSLLVAKGGEVIIAKAYGFAERETMRRVDTDTVFTVGSITKQFTGAAVLKLVEKGKVDVNDSIDKYFDNVPADKKAITLHHLLTHTSGLRDVFGHDFQVVTRDEIIKRAMKGKLKFDVGERHYYSNAGYSLLGAVIELVSGQSYDAFLHKHFFKPLGMTKTGYVIPNYAKDELAVGYDADDNRRGTVVEQPWDADGPYWNLRANGGIHSTVWDMYKWHKALLDDSVLSASSREMYFAPHADEGDGRSFYGYGWVSAKTDRGTTVYFHNGGNRIFFADCFRYVDDEVFIIAMTNATSYFRDEARIIRRILFGAEYQLPKLRTPEWLEAFKAE